MTAVPTAAARISTAVLEITEYRQENGCRRRAAGGENPSGGPPSVRKRKAPEEIQMDCCVFGLSSFNNCTNSRINGHFPVETHCRLCYYCFTLPQLRRIAVRHITIFRRKKGPVNEEKGGFQ